MNATKQKPDQRPPVRKQQVGSLPSASQKDLERFQLQERQIKPEECRYLNPDEIVEALNSML